MLVVADAISPDGVRCHHCVALTGTSAWHDPNKNLGMCAEHYQGRLQKWKAEDRDFCTRLRAYSEQTGNDSGRRLANAIAHEWQAFNAGTYDHLRTDPRQTQRDLGFDMADFRRWERTST